METKRVAPKMEFSDLWMISMRHWKLVFASVLIFGILGAVFGLAIPARYSASASLTVSPLTTSPFAATAPQQVNIATEREVMGSREVAEAAAKTLEGVDVEELMSMVSVAAPSGSQVLKVSVRDSNPERAAALANAMSQAYLSFRSEGAKQIAAGQISILNQQVADLTSRDSLTPAEREELSSLHEQLTALGLVGQVPGRVISPATVPGNPASPGVLVFLSAGLTMGFLLGCGFVLTREGLRRRKDGPAMHSAREAGRPTREGLGLGVVKGGSADPREPGKSADHPRPGAAEESLRP